MSIQTLPAATTSRVVDASRRDLSKVSQISAISGGRMNIAAVNLDGNNLSTLHGIKQFPALVQLSVSDNSLVRMEEVCALCNLVSLNLQNNSLSEITGLERLVHLEWLSLAGNSIKAMDRLASNGKISHLDLSDNCIGNIGNISMLSHLKTLLLHGNALTSLEGMGEKLPPSLATLSLAENEVADLNEVFFLSVLPSLRQLSLMSNPCVSLADSAVFDYRPYVCYWCPGLKTLDGFPITNSERSCSATLFPSDKPCPFTVGQHRELIRYLFTASPLHTTQLLSSKTGVGGNANNPQSSVAGLEDVIKSYEQQAADPKQADIVEKLKALQLVEQMIKSQEHILLTQQHNGCNNIEPGPPSPGDQVIVAVSTEPSLPHSSPPRPVLTAWDEASPKKSQSPPQARPERPVVTSADQGTVSSTTATSGPAADRKTEQLKLLNAKLAQRHSKVVQKPTKSAADTREASSGVSKAKKTSQPSVRKAKPKSSDPVKSVTTLKTKPKSKEKSKKVITSTSPPTDPKISLPKQTTLTKPQSAPTHLIGDPTTTTQSKLPLPPTPSKSEPSISSVKPPPDVSPAHTSDDPDLLSSTSYYVPLTEDTLEETTLDSQFEAALEQESMLDSTALASSLTQAYGLPGTGEGTLVLSSLWSHSADQPSSTQAGRESDRTVGKVSNAPSESRGHGMRPELNGNGLEEFVAQNSIQLQGCRQELAHQSQLLQLQEEILQTLLAEVEGLRQWRSATEIRERRRAAVVIQKYWRGYKARKEYPVSTTLSNRNAAWALCLSLKKEVVELRSALSALMERMGSSKKVRFEEDSPDYPPPTELQMSHYSISCILLKWAPALAPSRPDLTTLKCYRVYVNGEVEGMVGPEKCKAYIEGLDRGTTYRITVRAVYNTGESVDSNPVVASLNPTKPTTQKSHTDHNPDHSSDEETGGHKKTHRLPPFSPGEPSAVQGLSESQQDSNNNTQEASNQTTDVQDGQMENSSTQDGEQPAGHEVLPELVTSQQDTTLELLDTTVEPLPNEQGSPPKGEVPGSPHFHFQKAKHITIDTVSVLSGGTVEYSPPLPVVSTSADTLLGESSLEYDKESSSSDSDSTSTVDGSTEDVQVESSEQVTMTEHVSSENDTPFITDHTKQGVDHPPTTSPSSIPTEPSSVPTDNITFNHSNPQSIQSLPTGVLGLHSTEMYTPVSKNLLGALPAMSHGIAQESDQLLLLSTLTEQHLMTEAHVDSLPLHNGNNISHVPTTLDIHTEKTKELFKDNGGVQFDTNIPHTHTSLIAPRTTHSALSALVVSNELLPDTPEITSMVDSHTTPEEPEVSLDRNYRENSKADDGANKELVSNDHTTVTQVGGTNVHNTEREAVVPETSHLETPPKAGLGCQLTELPTSSGAVLSPSEQESSSSSSVDLASQLLLELEKDLSQST